jgi:succinate dehydrogenase / fumarate reductase flavoprotein subunit
MIILAEAILRGALLRTVSRGGHYKPEFPDRNDEEFLKATIATYDPANNTADIRYAPVDTSLVQPRARTYGKKESPAAPTPAAKATTAPANAAPAPAPVGAGV